MGPPTWVKACAALPWRAPASGRDRPPRASWSGRYDSGTVAVPAGTLLPEARLHDGVPPQHKVHPPHGVLLRLIERQDLRGAMLDLVRENCVKTPILSHTDLACSTSYHFVASRTVFPWVSPYHGLGPFAPFGSCI